MEIHWRKAEKLTEDEREAAERLLESLAADHNDLIDVWIEVDESPHHRQGNATVSIRCQARGEDLVVRERAHEPSQALRDVLDAFDRDVRKMRDRRLSRRTERPPAPPHLGVVDTVFAEEGYGFLITDGGERVYFHRNAVSKGLAFETLGEGQRVALNYEAGEEGLQATFVAPPPPDAGG